MRDHVCSCSTCRDEATEMLVLSVDDASGLALCRTTGGRRRQVEVALIDNVTEGVTVLVHADVAIARAGAMGSPA